MSTTLPPNYKSLPMFFCTQSTNHNFKHLWWALHITCYDLRSHGLIHNQPVKSIILVL